MICRLAWSVGWLGNTCGVLAFAGPRFFVLKISDEVGVDAFWAASSRNKIGDDFFNPQTSCVGRVMEIYIEQF